tara:strand:- start:9703 stop:11085 length:1383 start_codon:yes stop_codon:yes gene_type:complete
VYKFFNPNNFTNPSEKEVDELFKVLFPINRSLTGIGNKETLEILSKIVDLETINTPSGKKIYDWIIPDEWIIRNAFIKNSEGKKVIDWQKNNLHVLNYSRPIHKKNVTKKELLKNLFTLPDKKDWIPYRTSYYKPNWGFCLSENQLNSSEFSEPFEIFIDSELDPKGSMLLGESYHRGVSDKEIIISSYFCHPSLANDNLSGIITAVYLFNEIKKRDTYYSYRLILCPETIGALAFLNQHKSHNDIYCGFVVSTTAGPDLLGVKESFLGDHEIDQLSKMAVESIEPKWIHYGFRPDGSDERQYSSPGFRIPTVTITKSKYYEYDEYHTSADNLEFVSSKNLLKTLNAYLKTFELLEANRTIERLNNKGEDQLGIKGLMPPIGGTINQSVELENKKGSDLRKFELDFEFTGEHLNAYEWIMHMADSSNTILDISNKSNIDFYTIYEAASMFHDKNLIKVIG